MTDFNDELLAGLDDDASKAAAESRRQAAFEARVETYIQAAQSPRLSKSKRLKAVQWLGESGEPKAIPTLVRIYNNSDDVKMREAAEYSLGMLRALDDAIDGTDQERDKALDLLEKIVHEGHIGKRANPRPYFIAIGLLLLTFLIFAGVAGLMAAGMIELPDGPAVAQVDLTPSATPLPPDPDHVGAQLRLMHTNLTADAGLLLQQMQVASRGQSIDCSLTLSADQPFVMPAGLPEDALVELEPIAEAINEVQADLSPAMTAFQRSCTSQTAIPRQDALNYGDDIVAIQVRLRELTQMVLSLPEEFPTLQPTLTQPPATPTTAETATPRVTPTTVEPTPEPTSVISNRELQQQLVSMQNIVDEMTNLRGGVTVLVQYWNDVDFSGSTLGCREPVPTIPEDIVLSDEMAAAAPESMLQAVENLNLGLGLSRQAWTSFTETCNRGEDALRNVVAQQKIVATTAQAALSDAEDLIAQARTELR